MTFRKRRILAALLALALCLSLLPMSALAAEADALGETGPEEAVCTCTAPCTEGGMNTACPVCGAEGAAPEDCGQSLSQGSGEAKTQPLANEGISLLSTQEKVSYIDPTEEQTGQTCTSATVVTADDTTWGDDGNNGWYVVNSNVTIGQRVTVTGDVHLILTDGSALTVDGGINVAPNNTFTVYGQSSGTGKLITKASADGNSGIGGNSGNVDFGTVNICGGNIVATGGKRASGIGGGGKMDANAILKGSINIYGGTVSATGGAWGAGIGGCADSTLSANAITISGGVVTAQHTGDGVGIGSGNRRADYSTLSTGENGNAIIFVSSFGDKIMDDTENWSGVIFNGPSGQVYGDSITVAEDFTIPQDYTLFLPRGTTLTIPEGVTIINDGTIYNNGHITDPNAITGSGTVIVFPDPSENVAYLTCDNDGKNWTTKTKEGGSYTVATPVDTAWGASDGAEHWYVVGGDMIISKRITVTGDVHLILKDGFTLNATKGINVSEGNSLTIYAQSTGESMGTLIADNLDWGVAAIGSEPDKNAGTITICGGNFTVTGGMGPSTGGAGIGSGTNGNGGTIAIHGGVVHAFGSGGAGIGSGFKNNNDIQTNGGNIQITGGTVIVTSEWGDGIGGGWSSNSGTFSTGSDGHAVIFANRIGDNTPDDWSGVIFQGSTGQVYGTSVTPTEDFTIPTGYTLTIPAGATLDVSNVSVTNNGTIICNGTINGTVDGDVRYPSAVTVSVNQGGQSVASVPYGSTITITATMQRAQSNSINMLAELDTVDFYLGSVESGTKLNTTGVSVVDNSGTYTATLEITLNNENWKPSDTAKTITADFGGVAGTSGNGLISSTGSAELTVTKVSQTAPAAPTMSSRTTDSVTLNAISSIGQGAVQYGYVQGGSGTPNNWQDGTTFTGLSAGTTYTFYARYAGNDYYEPSPVSTGTSIVTLGAEGGDTLADGETITTGDGTTIKNDGEKIIITPGDGGSVTVITPADNVTVNTDEGTVNVPDGSTVTTGDGPSITVGEGGATVGTDGGVTLPDGGSATIGSGDDTTTITTPGGGTVDPDTGAVMPDEGGSVVIGSGDDTTTITPPSGQPVTPNEDGTITVPDGSTVETGDGPEMTLPEGGTIDPDTGAVTPDEGGSVVIDTGDGTTTITPPSGQPVAPNDDGSVTLPGGSTVTGSDGESITIPPEGGTLQPGGDVYPGADHAEHKGGGDPVALPPPALPDGALPHSGGQQGTGSQPGEQGIAPHRDHTGQPHPGQDVRERQSFRLGLRFRGGRRLGDGEAGGGGLLCRGCVRRHGGGGRLRPDRDCLCLGQGVHPLLHRRAEPSHEREGGGHQPHRQHHTQGHHQPQEHAGQGGQPEPPEQPPQGQGDHRHPGGHQAHLEEHEEQISHGAPRFRRSSAAAPLPPPGTACCPSKRPPQRRAGSRRSPAPPPPRSRTGAPAPASPGR